MKKRFFTLALTYLATFQHITSQPLAAESKEITLWSDEQYKPITDMSAIDIAIFDARQQSEPSTLDYFRRYYDEARLAHPSILDRHNRPSHFFVLANNIAEAKASANRLAKQDTRNTQCILLLAGPIVTSDTIPSVYNAVFHSPQRKERNVDLLVQAAFGGIEISRSKSNIFNRRKLSARSSEKTRLGYGKPEDCEMSKTELLKIDEVMQKAISSKATPGGYILVARRGTVVFSKAYGYTNYHKNQRVTPYHLYDLASVSKAIGTLPIIMQLYEDGDLLLTDQLGRFFPHIAWKKQQITMQQLLLHTSGLQPSIPSFLLCLDSTTIKKPLYSSRRKKDFSVQIEPRLYTRNGLRLSANYFSNSLHGKYENVVAQNLFATNEVKDIIYNAIDNVQQKEPTYRYSDLNFVYLQRIAEQITHRDLDILFDKEISKPLGLKRLTYCPLLSYEVKETIPTENDKYFRHQQVQGTVHDQMAALLGGIAGNAGLFGTANEIAKLAQLFLNGGTYGGVKLFSVLTINKFTQRQTNDCRRGLGFDKPEFRIGKDSPVTSKASLSSYGHSGFSGTLFWIDPQEELIYIFLSNSICPNVYNNLLSRTNVRSDIHKIIYESIEKWEAQK